MSRVKFVWKEAGILEWYNYRRPWRTVLLYKPSNTEKTLRKPLWARPVKKELAIGGNKEIGLIKFTLKKLMSQSYFSIYKFFCYGPAELNVRQLLFGFFILTHSEKPNSKLHARRNRGPLG